jgi:membrane protease YdiL (CAAX protease family)
MRTDLPLRVVPLLAVPLLAAAYTPLSPRTLGLSISMEDARRQLLLSAALGPPMGWLAWRYRRRYVRWVVVPTWRDNLFQSAYFVFLNAPAEELFFRGLLLGGLRRRLGAAPAWLLSTLIFGAYHIPARWGRPAVLGVTLAGGVFGALFLAGPGGGSLLLPTGVHALATCGFLSAGPWAAHALAARRAARRERE